MLERKLLLMIVGIFLNVSTTFATSFFGVFLRSFSSSGYVSSNSSFEFVSI